MQIEKLKNGSTLTMKVSGRLDTLTAPELEKEVTESLNGVTDFVMDFSGLEYISSAGLRTLLFANKKMKGKGTYVILNVRDEVKDIFDVTGFADILTIK